MPGPTHKALFLKYRDTPVINRCEQYATWTLPYLMADTAVVSHSGRVIVERDFQEAGALLVNNLAAKLARVLFPTQFAFFQASASETFKRHAARKGMDAEALRSSFAKLELEANKRLFLNSGYAALILALKYLIVTGQVLLHRDSKKGTVTAYGLQMFAVRRDGKGGLLDCILREYTSVESLPEAIQAALRHKNKAMYSRPEQRVEHFTRIHRQPRNGVEGYEVSEQVDTIDVGTPSWYPANLCPWMCPTWVLVPGEHYGRGMVEDYAGGFARLSSFSEASALYGVEIMRVLHMVGNGSGTDVDEAASSESGEWIKGDPNSVAAYEAGDDRKLVAVVGEITRIVQSLSRAFMYTAITRQAERVTAYELQRDAQEAENTLGGVYSSLSGGVQVPLAHILMTEVSDVALAGLITGELRPDVTAGIPALGRSADVSNLLAAAQELTAVFPVAQLDKRINPSKLVDIILAGRSVDPSSIFFTPDEQRANEEAAQAAQNAAQAAMQAQLLQQAPEAITGAIQGG